MHRSIKKRFPSLNSDDFQQIEAMVCWKYPEASGSLLHTMLLRATISYWRSVTPLSRSALNLTFVEVSDSHYYTRRTPLDDVLEAERAQISMLLCHPGVGLTSCQLTVIQLRYWEDMTPSEISDFLGQSKWSVQFHLKQALERLRRYLKNAIAARTAISASSN